MHSLHLKPRIGPETIDSLVTHLNTVTGLEQEKTVAYVIEELDKYSHTTSTSPWSPTLNDVLLSDNLTDAALANTSKTVAALMLAHKSATWPEE